MDCPCHSGLPYAECCQPIHLGKKAPTPLILMRSRYAAYALGKIDYIMQTTHPEHPDKKLPQLVWRRQIEDFCKKTQFLGLTIQGTEESNPFSYVTFFAHLKQKKEDISFTERSQFAQIEGNWLYLHGDVQFAMP